MLRGTSHGSARGTLCLPCRASIRNFRVARTNCHRGLQRPKLVASSAESTTQDVEAESRRKNDLLKACKTVKAELAGLDFGPIELSRYFELAAAVGATPPKGAPPGFDMNRAAAAWKGFMKGNVDGASMDVEALGVVELMLSELWRWRRRGGQSDLEERSTVHEQALREIQNVTPEEIDRITSSLLDSLPISGEEKREIGTAVQNVAVASIQSFVWGGIVFTVLGLIMFNFVRG